MLDILDSPSSASAAVIPAWTGVVRYLHITPRAFLPMRAMAELRLIAGRGIEGDRYMIGREEGFYSHKPEEGRQVTLFEFETLVALKRDHNIDLGPEEHRRMFMTFVAGLLADFDRYLERGDVDLLRDGVSYRLAGLWLDDAEFAQLMRELASVLQPRLASPPAPGRRRRILASVLLPGEAAGSRVPEREIPSNGKEAHEDPRQGD